MEGQRNSLVRSRNGRRSTSNRKYLVRYVQCSADSNGFDPYNDFMLDLVFDSTEEAHKWCREYVDPYMEESCSDTSVIDRNGTRREVHIIKCMYDMYSSPDHLHQLSDTYVK